jgi:hypothetical protein
VLGTHTVFIRGISRFAFPKYLLLLKLVSGFEAAGRGAITSGAPAAGDQPQAATLDAGDFQAPRVAHVKDIRVILDED